jgi:hypothetical protein
MIEAIGNAFPRSKKPGQILLDLDQSDEAPGAEINQINQSGKGCFKGLPKGELFSGVSMFLSRNALPVCPAFRGPRGQGCSRLSTAPPI